VRDSGGADRAVIGREAWAVGFQGNPRTSFASAPGGPTAVSLLFARSRVVILSISHTSAGTSERSYQRGDTITVRLPPEGPEELPRVMCAGQGVTCAERASTPVLEAMSILAAVTFFPLGGAVFALPENTSITDDPPPDEEEEFPMFVFSRENL